jgi:adenylate cyclase
VTNGDAALLVVDDNEDNRYALTRRLTREGYANIATAVDGEQALELVRKKPFDLVLLDIMMPKVNGYEVLTQMKADEKLRHIPVIMISAVDELESVVRCIENGAEDYLSKPFNPILLRARVGASLERKRLHDQIAAWNRTLEERVEQQLAEIERVSRLKRFLSPQVTELILSSGDERVLDSHRRAITVLFCDLRGFTAFSETAEPEEVMSVLREYHAVLGNLIHKHEGTVERFAGDAIMVLFNDPLPCPDPNMRAVGMAMEMRDRVGELASKWRKQGHELGFGVGIAHGYATLGRIGFEGRFDYGAVGTVVNLAARLCADAKDGQILIDSKVQSAIEASTSTEPAGELSLKGFQRPVRAFNICLARAAVS